MNAQDIRNLQEAYMEVYSPQELIEEKVWGEVENLVNYLIEEGYDLSDYTWEEMYESYIEEQGRPANRRTGGPSVAQVEADIAAKDAAKAAKAAQRGPTGAAARPELQFKSTKVPSPATSTNRSQQFRDTQRLNRTTGGGLMGTIKPTNLPSRAPKPAWEKPTLGPSPKPTTTKPTPTSTAKSNSYRPGATVRATGPNMNKFPQLQRFANQGRRIAEPVVKSVSALAALRNITPAGVAAAVSAPRPTASGTLSSALKRGDYKPQQGPKNPDQGLSKAQSFDKAYKTAKNKGMGSTFTWNNKSYKVEEYEYLMNYILSERYAETAEAAEVIMVNMSEEWISTILEIHSVDAERLLMQNLKNTGEPYNERRNLKSKPRKRTVGN
tara:strand:+ start:1089 stop:2234 length:1146 start_codon:yes stop_codon:yes gene_type:complete